MRKELKETIDSTIQSAIATGMEKLSQSTTVLVQEMFVGLAKQQFIWLAIFLIHHHLYMVGYFLNPSPFIYS